MINPENLYIGMNVKISKPGQIYPGYAEMAKKLHATRWKNDAYPYGDEFKVKDFLTDSMWNTYVLISNKSGDFVFSNTGITEAIDLKEIKIPSLQDLLNT